MSKKEVTDFYFLYFFYVSIVVKKIYLNVLFDYRLIYPAQSPFIIYIRLTKNKFNP